MSNKKMNIWRPYTQMLQADDALEVDRAQNSILVLKNGQKLLDGISSWWVITHGHCRPEISEAIAKQAEKMDQVVFANFTHSAAEELVDALSDLLPPSLNQVFFSDNGSTTVEVAMKMAYQYQAQCGHSQKKRFVAFESAYHGDTCGAMSVTADGTFTQAYSSMRFDVIRCKQGAYLSDSHEVWLSDFYQKIERYHSEIAALIIEPLLQGAGGMIVWPKEAIREIARICREKKILLIFDEVMTGFGRTGSLFAFEQLDFVPDFVCLSKGLTGGSLPLSLTLTTDQIYEAFLSSRTDQMLFHGHSFTGNAISCAAALANLKIFKTTGVLQQIAEIEKAHRQAIHRAKSILPLKDTRVLGPVGIIELECLPNQYGAKLSKMIASECLKAGVFIRPLGNVIYLMPPYCTTPQMIQEAWEVITRSCLQVLEQNA